jgi:hypothetical protein
MTALPLTEALISPLLGCLLAISLPFGTARFLAWAYLGDLGPSSDDRSRRLVPFRRAALLVGLAQVQLLWSLGLTRLGPTLVEEPGTIPSLAFGAFLAILAFLAGGAARRIEEPAETRPSALAAVLSRLRLVTFAAGPVVLGIATTRLLQVSFDSGRAAIAYGHAGLALGLCFLLLAAVSLGGTRRLARVQLKALCDDPGPAPRLQRSAGWLLGLTLFVALLSVPLSLVVLTDVPPESIHTMSTTAAGRRLHVDPWDGEAMLAAAWRARDEGLLDLAEVRAEAAGRMNADAQSVHALWAELHAARGDCTAARDAFERSLAAGAAAAFGDPFGELSLGNYSLPPTLVTECDVVID